ncbi:uncharacterized protein TOT_020000247 [Theileria orientalis strain Shintoku]|uniref:PUL domain-containing protein n=1 Tax=Theileria orientalis strain Shintoku TaxID=869250 RepID=J4D759_THEOR|nr:uncharacterized protein TOT_020000247 [Theileria orientalis strain Shintoku]PVC53040.1 hypothetical protein MACL_00000356 [Theileria orientalis]BAM39980.1 uncharacterized protein TOT_020000247 [Theileria orientalis strain Shintoku]|eukprot:XP_009690281.1 uncharacterized protein TOT_020000247 [Theileria orientalis strain Shintoku]
MDSEGISENNLTPFNSSYQLHRELYEHEKGVRCGCNIDAKYLSLLDTDKAYADGSYEYEYLVTGGVNGDLVVCKLTKCGEYKAVSRFMAHVNTVMCVCPSVLLNDYIDVSFLESSSNTELTLVEVKMCIYTCGRDKLIHRYNLAGKKLLTLEGHDDVVCSLHELSDPSKLVSGSWDGTAIVWDVLSGTQEYRIKSDQYKYSVYVNSLPSGEIVTAMQNGDVCLWKGNQLVTSKKLHSDAVRAVSVGEKYLTCSNDCTIKVNSNNLETIFTIDRHEGFVYDVKHSRFFEVAFSGSEDKTARVWSTVNGHLLQTINLESSVWQVVETQYNGIATIELSGKVTLWSLRPGRVEENYSQQSTLNARVEPQRPENILDMNLFKKFNSEKAKELILKYNEEKNTLVDREVLYFEELFEKGVANLRDGYDFTWVLKMLEWPEAERLPVFDLIKAASLHMVTEKLFKVRNNGSRILFSANEVLKNTDNPQLISVSLQMFSNLLHPSISRSVMFRQHESIFEAVAAVTRVNSKLAQQSLSVFCQNFAIASVHNRESRVIGPLVQCLCGSVSVCLEVLDSEDLSWVGAVSLKHFKTMELLLDNFTVPTMEHSFKHGLNAQMELVANKLHEKKIMDAGSSGSVKFVLDSLKT